MEPLSCTYRNFIFRPSCIEGNDEGYRRPRLKIAGAFCASWARMASCREINNPDAVNLNSLWN
jgi:hypothetical protein